MAEHQKWLNGAGCEAFGDTGKGMESAKVAENKGF